MPKKPEWTPDENNPAFATKVQEGVSATRKQKKNPSVKPAHHDADYYIAGIRKGDSAILARAITILESNAEKHFQLKQEILSKIIKLSGNSLRIGITGAPGAGKSTFIDTLGTILCEQGHKLAVLAIDPSSSVSGGSILGDKTRMENLARHKNAFIRPAPSGDNLGGVARKTRESIIACEAGGYDIIFVETIGVGQSEITVRSMVDFFLLILLPGEGDELQGLKKGTVELADTIVINKADSDNLKAASITKQQYQQAVHYILPATKGWDTKVLTASALNNININKIWDIIKEFEKMTKSSGIYYERRKEQRLSWFHSLLQDELFDIFYNNKNIKNILPKMEIKIKENNISVSTAVNELINIFLKK